MWRVWWIIGQCWANTSQEQQQSQERDNAGRGAESHTSFLGFKGSEELTSQPQNIAPGQIKPVNWIIVQLVLPASLFLPHDTAATCNKMTQSIGNKGIMLLRSSCKSATQLPNWCNRPGANASLVLRCATW
jgi:hypothetical protein